MTQKRKYNEYDLLKIAATFLVVIGHVTIRYNSEAFPQMNTCISEFITKLIYVFHMPLFMSLSGAIYQLGKDAGKYRDFCKFIGNKAQRLLVPYIFVGTLFLLPTISLCEDTPLSFYEYGNFLIGKDCRHLWYLLALFEIFVIHFILTKMIINNSYLLLMASIAASFCFSYYCNFDLLCVNMAARYYPYFILGVILSKFHICSNKIIYLSIALTAAIACLIYVNNIKAIDIIMSIMLPIPIIVFMIFIFRKIVQKINLNLKLIELLLSYSFPIYLFHVMIIYLWNTFVPIINYQFISILSSIIISIAGSVLITIIIRMLHGEYFIGEKKYQ